MDEFALAQVSTRGSNYLFQILCRLV